VVVDAPPFSIDLCTKDRLFTLSVDTEQEMLLWALVLLTAAPRLAPPVAGAAAKAAALSVPETSVPAAVEAEAAAASAIAVDPVVASLEAGFQFLRVTGLYL
jgi:hypothetical protein